MREGMLRLRDLLAATAADVGKDVTISDHLLGLLKLDSEEELETILDIIATTGLETAPDAPLAPTLCFSIALGYAAGRADEYAKHVPDPGAPA